MKFALVIILQMATVLRTMATNLPFVDNVGGGYCPQYKEVRHDILGCFAGVLQDEGCLKKDQISLGKVGGSRHGRCLCDTIDSTCNLTAGQGPNGYDRFTMNPSGLATVTDEGYCSSYKEVQHDLLGCFSAALLDPECLDKHEVSFGKGDEAGTCLCDTITSCNATHGLGGVNGSDLDPDDFDRYYMPTVPAPPTNWTIQRNDSSAVTAVFAHGNDTEVSIEFEVRNGYGQTVDVSLYASDCQSDPEPVNSIAVSHNLTYTGTDWNLLQIDLDVKEDIIANSSLWIQETSATGIIEACLFIELLSEDMNFESIYFHKYPLRMTVDMSKTFTVDGIVPTPDEVGDGTDVDFNVDYTVTACQCDGAPQPSCDFPDFQFPLKANEYFHLCILSDSDEVEIKKVETLTLTQDGNDITFPITGGRPNAITSVRKTGGHAVVTTQLPTAVFMSLIPSDGNASDVVALGEVALEFAPSYGRRMTETGRTRPHMVRSKATVDAGSAPYEVELHLASNEDAEMEPIATGGYGSSDILVSVIGSVGATIFLALVLVVWRKRGRSGRSTEE